MIDHGSVNARVRAFDKENGSDYVRIDGMCVYSNGAMRSVDPMGILADPPESDYERNRIIVRYWEERVRGTRDAFGKLKHRCKTDAADSEMPAEDAEGVIERLTTLRSEIKRLEAQLRAAKATLLACTPSEVLTRTRSSDAVRKHNADFLAAVDKLKI